MINSYAVVQSGFGSYWVGSSQNQPNGKKYFTTHEQAVEIAMIHFTEKYGEFDPEDEDRENYYDILEEYDTINDKEYIEEIGKGLERFVISG